jgi:outer membrane receptor protein involved in Fe transport
MRLCITSRRAAAAAACLSSASLLTLTSALAQNASPPSTASATEAREGADDEEVVRLSPFEVTTDNRGYQATTSMSGTRLNTRLEDLAASISVVTKQQLVDTAALDINDIFLYEANTEGLQQYTEFTIDRNFYVETTTLAPQSANRVRGIGVANTSVNNFATTGTVPLDTYILESVEISRGPNANIFGLGNAAGTVNVVLADANTRKNHRQVIVRGDSYGGWRASADVNQVVKEDVMAVRVAVLRDEKGFERQPAYEKIDRKYAAFKYTPFRNTQIRASYESYNNRFSRANTTLPRDSITEWQTNGMPVWNPTFGTTGGWRFLNGSTYTGVTAANETTQLPVGLMPGSLNSGLWNNPAVYIERDGRVTFYGMGAVSNTMTGPAPAGTPTHRLLESGSTYRRGSTAAGVPLTLFQAPSLTDKSVYDWENVNFLAPNFGRDKADVYRVELEQTFINNGHHLLAARVGQFREVTDKLDHSVFSRSDSGVPYIVVDVNETLVDGTPNPNFLRPYMGASTPTTSYRDERNTHSRGEIAYQLDVSDKGGWFRYIGKQVVNAYMERRDLETQSLGSRDLNISDYSWTSANDLLSLPLRGNSYRQYPRYYIGDKITNEGPVMDHPPATTYNLGTTPLTWYRSNRTRVDEPATIQEIIQSGSARHRQIISGGVVWQGSFWNDRIVPTIGWRSDRNRERSSRNLNSNPLSPTQPNSTIDPTTRLHNLDVLDVYTSGWEEKRGQSRQAGVVVKPLSWLNLNYNRSTGFKPEPLAYNINTELLPNPTGSTEDYGVTLKLLDDRLTARVTRYKTVERNSRNGSITSAAVTRTLRLFFDPRLSNALTGGVPATPILPNGQDAFDLEQSATQWALQMNTNWTVDQARAWAMETYLKPLGISEEFITRVRTIGDSGFTDVNTVTSTGTEIELTFNPNRHWTMKLAGAQQKAVDTELGNDVNDFINSRLAAVRTIRVPVTPQTQANGTAGLQWWTVGATSPTATGANTPSGFYVQNVKSVIGLATANAGKPRAQTREYRLNFTTNYRLAGIRDEGWMRNTSIGGAVRWASKAALGYYGMPPSTDPEYRGAIIEYDPNRAIYDEPETNVDLMVSYNLKLFRDKVGCKLQLNVRNVFEGGHLEAIAYNPDGQAWNYRIVDPRQFILTATFDF